MDSLAPLAERRGITIGVDIAPVSVEGDPERLEQLVTLLLDNAVRHARDGGACRVTVARDAPDAVLEVEDDGPGIRPGDEQRVFDRFWRAPDAPEGGSGLGLDTLPGSSIATVVGSSPRTDRPGVRASE